MQKSDFDQLSLQALIELRDQIARALKRRFERSLALLFTDVVGSTDYVSKHGDVAGRELLQRHHALVRRVLAEIDGRLVDTAGDGAFCVAESLTKGARALVRLQQLLLEDNREVDSQNRLQVRSGLHWSSVLVDEQFVTGESVHLAARIAGTAGAGEIRLSEQAFRELPAAMRPLCRRLEARALKGIPEPVEMLELDWRDPVRFPTAVEIVEAETVRPIPFQSRVALGRLAEHEGRAANDIVLSHPDSNLTKRISRWQVELEMTPEGYLLRAVSRAATEVDGRSLSEGESTLIQPGSTARLSSVLTLRFRAPGAANETALGTLLDG